MMSASDPSDVASPAAGENKNNDTDMKQVWRFIYVDMKFIKSLYGIFVIAELVLSLLGLISVSVPKQENCAFLYGSSYIYYEFVSSSCFIVSIIWFVLYGLAITKRLGFVRWDIAEIIWCGFYAFNYLIASSVIAARACFQGGYKAAAVFGFLCLFVIIAHGVFILRSFMEKRSARSSSSQASPQADNPDQMEDPDASKY